jgi:hypothetical protein
MRKVPSAAMAYRWQYGNAATAPEFDDQAEAEAWLGEHWEELRDAGVDEVTLLDGDEKVYGPMSLHSP